MVSERFIRKTVVTYSPMEGLTAITTEATVTKTREMR
jgi:hypothetical protein